MCEQLRTKATKHMIGSFTGSPPPAMGGTSAFERFIDDILGELKDLEPDGYASRGHGRVNYLSTDEPNPMQEDLDALFQNQEIIMSDYINWVSSRENGSEILNEKRIKELVKEAFNECQADFMPGWHAAAAEASQRRRSYLQAR